MQKCRLLYTHSFHVYSKYMIVIHIRSFCEIERHFVNFCMKSETDDEYEASLFFWDKSNTSVCESHEMNLGAEAS